MTLLRDRWLPLTVLVAALVGLVGSLAWVTGAASTGGPPMGSAAVMGPVLRGDGPVTDVAGAERAADRFAERWDLAVGEVMQFDNGFYAELVDPSGQLATEVLVDPRRGDVRVEWGPAMMWNTVYGMHPAGAAATTISAEEAREVADRWLADHRDGERADAADAFPGYYTLHTMRGEDVVGMLSVNGSTGAVWHHSWHGELIAMSDHDEAG